MKTLRILSAALAAAALLAGPAAAQTSASRLEAQKIEGLDIRKVVKEVDETDYTILDVDRFTHYMVETGASNRTLNLPTLADSLGKAFVVQKVDAGAGDVVIDPEGAETIDGTATFSLEEVGHAVTVVARVSGWQTQGAAPGGGGGDPTGTPSTFAGYDGGGALDSVPNWSYDPARFNGVDVNATIVPTTSTSGTLNVYRAVVDPAATVTDTTWIQTQHEMNVGSGNAADMDDVVGAQFNVNSREDSDVDSLTVVQANVDLGDADAVSATAVTAIATSIDVDDQATVVAGAIGYSGNVNAVAGSTVANFKHFSLTGSLDDLSGDYGVLSASTNVASAASINSAFFGGTIGSVSGNFNGVTQGGSVSGTITGSLSTFTANLTVDTVNGGQAYSDFNIIDDVPTNSYQSFFSGADVETANSYTAFANAGQVTTIATNGVGFNDQPNIASTQNYSAFQAGGTVTATDNYKGVEVAPTATGDGTGSAIGLSINMDNVTNFTADQTLAIQAKGRTNFEGPVNYFHSAAPVDGGGTPTSIHTAISIINVPDDATIANADTFGLNTAMLMNMGEDSTVTAGPLGLGLAALALPAVLKTRAGSTLSDAAGAAFALSLDPTSDGGTVDEIALGKFLALDQGGTHTINKLYGIYIGLPGGDPANESWGIYAAAPSSHNFLAGPLKIGGENRTSNAAVGIEIEDRHIKSIGTAPTATVDANAGTGATCGVAAATDVAGQIQLTTTATASAAGAQCSIEFADPYGTAPICTFSPANAAAAEAVTGPYVDATTTDLVVSFADAEGVGLSYEWNYHCVETY